MKGLGAVSTLAVQGTANKALSSSYQKSVSFAWHEYSYMLYSYSEQLTEVYVAMLEYLFPSVRCDKTQRLFGGRARWRIDSSCLNTSSNLLLRSTLLDVHIRDPDIQQERIREKQHRR